MKTNYLIAISGPTAVGKTATAIAVAKHFDTEILSCDARQFYQEMSIGTAVPTRAARAAVKHHFIQHRRIFDPYTVGDFEADALEVLDGLFEKKSIALLAGGSGLYEKAVIEGLDDIPKTRVETREKLNSLYAEQGLKPLQQMLREFDPSYYEVVDLKNPKRLIRALEVCMDTARPYSSYRKGRRAERHFKTIRIVIDAAPEQLYDNINRRVDQMFESGLLYEAQGLYPYRDLNALQTVGYRELFRHFDGKDTLEEAKEAIKRNTRRYAKRQRSWYRNQIGYAQRHGAGRLEEIVRHITSKMV